MPPRRLAAHYPQRRDGRRLPRGRFRPADHTEVGEQRRQPLESFGIPSRGKPGQRAVHVGIGVAGVADLVGFLEDFG